MLAADSELLARLPPEPLAATLKRVWALTERQRDGEKLSPPRLTLHLAGGTSLKSAQMVGWTPPLAAQASGHHPTGADAMLLLTDAEGDVPLTVHAIPLPMVAALAIHHTHESLALFAETAAPEALAEGGGASAAPSPLQLQRRATDAAATLAAITGRTVPAMLDQEALSDGDAPAADRALEALAAALTRIAEDGLGQEALAKVGQLRVTFGSSATATMDEDGTLAITLPYRTLLPPVQLRALIERQLQSIFR